MPTEENWPIPESELSFETSRSSGPGGQNVNKTETRVVACFDLEASETLSGEQKALLRETLSSRLTRAGVLRVGSSRHRSQLANRRDAVARLMAIVLQALVPPTPRKATRPGRAARQSRLEGKRRRSRLKQLRQDPEPD
ncbi:MAG: alternative ribosome rescue aminoacyl-tRNA hydrolase ArfB [Thermoanaerobaculia bacterium]